MYLELRTYCLRNESMRLISAVTDAINEPMIAGPIPANGLHVIVGEHTGLAK